MTDVKAYVKRVGGFWEAFVQGPEVKAKTSAPSATQAVRMLNALIEERTDLAPERKLRYQVEVMCALKEALEEDVVQVDELSPTERGEGGFGSTGGA